jgi:hypothetical protein
MRGVRLMGMSLGVLWPPWHFSSSSRWARLAVCERRANTHYRRWRRAESSSFRAAPSGPNIDRRFCRARHEQTAVTPSNMRRTSACASSLTSMEIPSLTPSAGHLVLDSPEVFPGAREWVDATISEQAKKIGPTIPSGGRGRMDDKAL